MLCGGEGREEEVMMGAYTLNFRIEISVSLLLGRLSGNDGLGDRLSTLSFQFHLPALQLNTTLQFGIALFGGTASRNPRQVQLLLDFNFLVLERGVGLSLFSLALGFEHGSRCIDFGYFLFCAADTLLLTNLTLHSGISDVDFGLVEGSLVSLAAEVREILGPGSILKLFDITA